MIYVIALFSLLEVKDPHAAPETDLSARQLKLEHKHTSKLALAQIKQARLQASGMAVTLTLLKIKGTCLKAEAVPGNQDLVNDCKKFFSDLLRNTEPNISEVCTSFMLYVYF